ncbi:Uncharacterised protein [BD1-7 clade bacterium]|uniref:Protein translocase subunit SecA n=1 Tax=BD1-7 clade bacterium TaxID=2029982 RepID=A0A5S9QUE3_9GAMM|nr:Uncharacterised protein [BD1-7 clade bacterium]CAA0122918.1 Uncharacterised protein [BD1-7 clade bacterium]
MSDKFFFKGRQDARVNHTEYGYETKASHKAGSKKYPLELVVTSEERLQEVKAMLDEAGLYGDVSIDSSEGAAESIDALTASMNKKGTVVKSAPTPSRNDPCSCGSGKKFKKCCG